MQELFKTEEIRFTTFAAVQLSIIIVNYNVKHFLEQCLYSVQAAISNLQAEVIVVDNNSTDGSLPFLQPIFPWVKWIANTKNTGFGVANNQAVAAASGEYILFLNPDTLLPEDALEKCVAFMQHHPQAGALGIRMIDGSGQYLPESKRGFPSPITSLFKLSGFTSFFPTSKLFARYYLGHLNPLENNVVDVLAGAFMLVRNTALQQTGAFDEHFFMYGEDIDLSYRIQKAGWQNWYFAESTVIHFKGESTKKGSLNYVRMFYQAMNIFVQKHYGGGQAVLYKWLIQTAIWVRAFISLIGSTIKNMLSFFRTNQPQQLADTPLLVEVCADEVDFSTVKTMLENAGVSIDKIRQLTPVNISKDFIAPAQHSKNTEIVFCISSALSMKDAIDFLQKIPNTKFAFYHSGSNSIIGSQSKNSSGNIITSKQ